MAERDSSKLLDQLKNLVSPEVYSQVASQLGRGQAGEALKSNQNQNQNKGITEELAQLKPDVLREITIGRNLGEEVMDNQNQNQGKMADLVKLKPDVLQGIRTSLRGVASADDNQNQNQGSVADEELAKPSLKDLQRD